MLYIQKEPALPSVAQELNRIKRDYNWDSVDYTETQRVRMVFDTLDKKMIRHQLVREQKGLCAYCMRRIRDDENTTIEHLIPISQNGRAALDYENMLACCDGGRRSNDTNRVLCCDASKKETEIHTSPYNREQMAKIRYDKYGFLLVPPEETGMVLDINEVLKLNGVQDAEGRFLHDTSTRLVYSRKQAYEKYRKYIIGLGKKGKPITSAIKRRIKEIDEAPEREEFAGVLLFFLNRKLRAKQS